MNNYPNNPGQKRLTKESVFHFLKNHWVNLVFILLAVLLIILSFTFVSHEFFSRLSYEFSQPYTADHSLYMAVGKGMAEGKIPYIDMYENKPPMIFIVCYLSYIMTGDYYLVSLLSAFSMIGIVVLPILFLVIKCRREKASLSVMLMMLSSLFGVIVLLSCYGEKRSGEGQVELQGAFFNLLSLFFAFLIKEEKRSFSNPFIYLSGLFLGVSFFYKEPFGLLGALFLLFMVKDVKDLIYRFILIGGVALFFCLVILLSTRSFVPYFTIYLKNMFGSHVSIYGSPLERVFHVSKISEDLYKFSRHLGLFLQILFALDILFIFYRFIQKERNLKGLLYCIKDEFLVLFTLILSVFMVGLGGQYYNHHYIFALPYEVILIFLFVEYFPYHANLHSTEENKIVQNILPHLSKGLLSMFALVMVIITGIAFRNTEQVFSYQSTLDQTTKMKNDAKYLDLVLDTLDKDSYQYIGFNGFTPVGYTKHSAMGPAFAQDANNFQDETNFFCTSFMDQLSKVDIIVFRFYNIGVIKEKAETYINENFTRVKPQAILDLDHNDEFASSYWETFQNSYSLYYRRENK